MKCPYCSALVEVSEVNERERGLLNDLECANGHIGLLVWPDGMNDETERARDRRRDRELEEILEERGER